MWTCPVAVIPGQSGKVKGQGTGMLLSVGGQTDKDYQPTFSGV